MIHDLSCAVLACAVPIEVTRHREAPIIKGRKQETDAVETFTIQATVQPLDARELQRLPEGQRTEGAVKLWAVEKLHTAETSLCRVADRFEYREVDYQVDSIEDWFDLGGYYKMTATRLER